MRLLCRGTCFLCTTLDQSTLQTAFSKSKSAGVAQGGQYRCWRLGCVGPAAAGLQEGCNSECSLPRMSRCRYADESCAMGYCCFDRCWNTPHAWQAGWLTATEFDASNFSPGQTAVLRLDSQSVYGNSARSAARVIPSWAPGAMPLFVGYRTAVGVDAALAPGLAGRVLLHTSHVSGAQDAQFTYLAGALEGERGLCC